MPLHKLLHETVVVRAMLLALTSTEYAREWSIIKHYLVKQYCKVSQFQLDITTVYAPTAVFQ